MKTLNNIRSLMACVALAATVPAVLDAQVRPTFYGQPVLDRSMQIAPNNMDPALARIQQLAQGGQDFEAEAAKAGITVKDRRVLVEVQVGPVIGRVFDFDSIASGDTLRQRGWVAASALDVLAAQAHVSPVRQPIANSYGEVTNEAEAAMLGGTYIGTGLGVRVAVIDLGFGGLDNSAEVGQVLRFQGCLDADAENHGTAMIEAIRDIAPDATITAIRLDAELDIVGATLLAMEGGAHIIVCPLSWFELPGKGQACEAAAMAIGRGITWINAAGNFADRSYFEGENLSTENFGADTYVNFGADSYQFINGMNGGDRFSIHLAGERGLQLELFRWDGMSANFVLIGQGDADAPVQVVSEDYVEGMYYFPMVRQIAAGPIAPFRMFAIGGDLHFSVAEGSITNPAAMDEVISVGAVDVASYGRGAPEIYSSVGGGIFNLTLDLCGPTGCTTGTYGPQGFSGTSAACANVAGLMALQLADPSIGNAPERVDVTSTIAGEEAQLAWAPAQGHGTIMYRVEVAADERFGFVVYEGITLDCMAVILSEGREMLYCRVTAFNEFGAAPASNILALQFISTEDGSAPEDRDVPPNAFGGSDDAILTANLAAGQPEQGGEDNAAGCAGSSSTSGMAVMLAAIILGAAVVRTRRKHA
jgi:hypothetical protein